MNGTNISKNKKLAILLAVVATFLWGSAYPCIKLGYEYFGIASNDTGSITLFAGVRFALAGLVTIIYGSIVQKQVLIPKKNKIFGIVMLGLTLTFLQYIFYYIGMAHVSGAKGAIINSISTIFCVIAAHIYYKQDRITVRKAIGCVLGFVGVILINVMKGKVTGGFTLLGEGFLIVSACAVAVGEIINKEIAKDQDALVITGYQLFVGGVFLCLAGFLSHGSLHVESKLALPLMLYMVAISAVAFTIWSCLLKYYPMGQIAIYKFMIPIFGTILSGIFLPEDVFNVQIGVALIFVCIGVYLVNRES